MYKVGKWREPRLDVYLKGLAGRDKSKNVIVDRWMAESLELQGFNSKIQPASLVDLEQVWQAFENFGPSKDVKVDLNDTYIKEGVGLAFKCFGNAKEKLRPLDLHETIQHMKLDTSAGLTAIGKKKIQVIEYALTRAEQVIRGMKKARPCLMGIRTQTKDDGREYKNLEEVKLYYKGKTRLVWMYPAEMTIVEGMFAIALIDYFKKRKTPMTIGIRKGNMGARIYHEIQSRKNVYALDYSKFDSTISKDLILQAFKILKTNFCTLDDFQAKAWDKVVYYFVHTTIVMPDGNLYAGKQHGVPSGSFFTQLIDSVVNVILMGATSKKFGLQLGKDNFVVLGDDVLMSSPKKVELNQISDFLSKYGIIMHPDKCEKKPHYLGAYWKHGIPTRSLKEVIPKLKYPENQRQISDDPVIRQSEVNLIKLSYLSCYWNLSPLIFKRKGTRGETSIDGYYIKTYGMNTQFNLEEIVDRDSFLPGYVRYRSRYEREFDFGRNFAVVQFS